MSYWPYFTSHRNIEYCIVYYGAAVSISIEAAGIYEHCIIGAIVSSVPFLVINEFQYQLKYHGSMTTISSEPFFVINDISKS